MKEYVEQIGNLLKRLTRTQKIALVAVGVIFIILTILLFALRSSVNWVTLFSGLQETEAAVLTKRIQELGFQARFEIDTILVRGEDKSQIRFQLAAENALPRGSIGFSALFDNVNLMTTPDNVQKLNVLRGLQGEIEETIRNIESVGNVRVHLVLPEAQLWEEDQKPTTASIMLKFKPFKKLTKKQIQGIVNLTCYAVEGLLPKNVSITDENGNDLTAELDLKEADTPSSVKARQMEFQKRYEKYLEEKALGVLEPALGRGRAIVKVSADLNFDRLERSMKQYTPPVKGEDSGVLESRKSEAEIYDGKGSKPSGVPGTESNTNPSYQRVDNSETSKYKRENVTNNYLYNELSEHHIPSGGINKLTVAVILDEDFDQEKKQSRMQFSADQKKMFSEIVSASVGLQPDRGDVIRLSSFAFDKSAQLKMKEEFEKMELRENLKFWVPLILFLLFGIVIPGLYWLLKRNKEHRELELKRLEERRKIAIKMEKVEPQISLEEQEQLEKQEMIRQAAIENPDQFTSLLRAWLLETE